MESDFLRNKHAPTQQAVANKHPKTKNTYKARRYIFQDCYDKRKIYQNLIHNNLHAQHKSCNLAERVLGWQQTEPTLFHHPYLLPLIVGIKQEFVGTFSILLATQVINLCTLARSNHSATVKKNVGSHISNNRRSYHGGYTISDRDPPYN